MNEHFKKKNSSKLNPTKSVEVKDGLRNILLNIYYYSNKDVWNKKFILIYFGY